LLPGLCLKPWSSWVPSHLGSSLRRLRLAAALQDCSPARMLSLRTKEINSGVSQQLSDASALESLFTAGEANCIFQLIKQHTKPPARPPLHGALPRVGPMVRIPQVPPSLETGCPLSAKGTACLFRPFEHPSSIVRHA
jgi:hypothetical protein